MKFLTLLKKELREGIPWIILSIIFLYVISWFIIRLTLIYHTEQFYFGMLVKGAVINRDLIFRKNIIQPVAVLLFYIYIILAVILGLRHFTIPEFTRTWQFLIHRSVKKSHILTSKLAAGGIIIFCLSLAWLILACLAGASDKIVLPPDSSIILLGFFYGYLGFIVYAATGLCALTKARWFTTKSFPLIFIFIMYLMIFGQIKFINAFLVTFVVLALLIIQIYQTFLKREF